MSGFEIAGIVLGAFPLALEGVKVAKEYFRCLEIWWEYEAEFEDFIFSLENEAMSYSQNLELLLRPLELSEDDENALLRGEPKAWNAPQFQADLKDRIGERYYEGISKRLHIVNSALDEVLRSLPSDNGKIAYTSPTPVEGEVRRIIFSINRKREPLVTRIKNVNEFLYKHLHRDALIPRATMSKQRSTYSTLQSHAMSLVKSLRDSWSCACATPHQLGIATEWTTPAKSSRSSPKGKLKLVLNMEREAKIVTVDFEHLQETSGGESELKGSTLQQLSYVQDQIDAQKHSRQVVKAASSKSVSLAVVSATSTAIKPSGTSTEALWRVKSRRLIKSALRPIRNAGKGINTTSAGVNTTSSGTDSRRVSFAEPQASAGTALPPPSQSKPPFSPELNLCLLLTGQVKGPSVGFIKTSSEEHIRLSLEPDDQSHIQSNVRNTLRGFTFSTALLRERMLVGLHILRTIISLGASPWVPSAWDHGDIRLLQTQITSRTVNLPYIYHGTLAATLNSAVRPVRQQTEASLFTLGVLLLELLYQESLEQQPFRAEYLNNGKPNDYTDLCTAKRWQESVAQDFDEPIADVIRQCVDCAFQPRADFGEQSFLQAVLNGVLSPLEDFVMKLS